MPTISANTKIAAILKGHPDGLEAIISLSPKFTKLRNPILRKLMASRTTISMASKIGGCTVEDFFAKLHPLGFVADRSVAAETEAATGGLPAFLAGADAASMMVLDVRPVIESGKDPLNLILDAVKRLSPGQVLKLVNSFEPAPLVSLLGRQGYESHVEVISDGLVHTYFHRKGQQVMPAPARAGSSVSFDELLAKFSGRLKTIDVRELEMPVPMITILEHLDRLGEGEALFVYHKRIPVFLLPELGQRHMDYRISEIGENEVHMLIFRS